MRVGLFLLGWHLGLAACAAGATQPQAAEGDWPMFRCDAARSASSAHPLPGRLRLLWERKLPPQVPAWQDDAKLHFDRFPEPVARGGLVFFASTSDDTLTACDLATGAERWRFRAEGPIRLAPACWRDRVFAGSDDGRLYCLDAATGKTLWTYRPGPSARLLVGNERLISTWPVRGGPAVADDTVYVAAGVWPVMGVFVAALDAATGRVRWLNDSLSFTFRELPHANARGFSGLSPQGCLAVCGPHLIVPNSKGRLAVLERRSGRFRFYGPAAGPFPAAQGRVCFAGCEAFDVELGLPALLPLPIRDLPVLAPDFWHTPEGDLNLAALTLNQEDYTPPRRPGQAARPAYPVVQLRAAVCAASSQPLLRAANTLVVSTVEGLELLEMATPGGAPKSRGQLPLAVPVHRAIAAEGKLLAVTRDYRLLCFGGGTGEAVKHEPSPPVALQENACAAAVRGLLAASGAREGYAVVLGLKDGDLTGELMRLSHLHLVAVSPEPALVEALRRRMDAAGLYGSRGAALAEAPAAVELPPYLAQLIVSEDGALERLAGEAASLRRLFAVLRPYGGAAALRTELVDPGALAARVKEAKLEGAEVRAAGPWTLLIRAGPLPGAAGWWGQNADAGQTRASRDTLVRAPLGVLWFGNSLSNSLILPRHGNGPVEQVAGGRLFIEGPYSLSAVDVYTGRRLWTREFPELGKYFVNEEHQRGAHAIGSNFFAVPDAVYVAFGPRCQVLDPATGRTVKEFRLPEDSDWFFMLIHEDLLFAGLHPVIETKRTPRDFLHCSTPAYSRGLAALDRNTGEVLWTRRAQERFGHFAVAAGAGKVFAADGGRLLALAARTGKVLWESQQGIGPGVMYSAAEDLVVSGGVLRGQDGKLLWEQVVRPQGIVEQPPRKPLKQAGLPPVHPLWEGKWGPLLIGDRIITQDRRIFDLRTGCQRAAKDWEGREREWRLLRAHGCGPLVGSANLLTFRSGDAGFYDLARDGGTGNLGGFRSGCTNNLIPAEGVLNAPDYTRTCICKYQNRSSLAFIHTEEAEYWTFGAPPTPGCVAYNFGAPGDRRDQEGTLWWSSPGQPAQDLASAPAVATTPAQPAAFYHYRSRMKTSGDLAWVGASGLTGLRAADIPLPGVDARKELLLRLVFCEPGEAGPGERVFSVLLEDRQLLEDFDIAREAGGPWQVVTKEFRGVRPSHGAANGPPVLGLRFRSRSGEPLLCGVEVREATVAAPAKR